MRKIILQFNKQENKWGEKLLPENLLVFLGCFLMLVQTDES